MGGWYEGGVLARLLVVVSCSLGVVACDDGAEGDATTDTVDIGLLLPLTGRLSTPGTAGEVSVRLAQAAINEAGGVLGRPMHFIARDTAGDPTRGRAAAIELMEEQGVELLLGAFDSEVTAAVLAETVPRGALLISSNSASPELTDSDNGGVFFRTKARPDPLFAETARRLHAAGHTRLAILSSEARYNAAMGDVAEDTFAALDCGSEPCVVHRFRYPGDDPLTEEESRTLLQEALEEAPDVLYIIGFVEDTVVLLRASQFADYDGPIQVTGAATFPSAADQIADDVKARTTWLGEAEPEGQAIEAFEVAAAEAGAPFGLAEAYDAAFVLGLAIEAAGSTDAAAVARAITEVANAPGTPIDPGDFAGAMTALAAGRDLDYQGFADLEFDERGDLANLRFAEFGFGASGEAMELP